MWDKVLELVGSVAPVVGTLLGGSAGNVVGELVAKALGVENSPEAIEKELKNNPEAYLKLKELEVSKELALLKSQLENKVEDNRHVESYVNAQAGEYKDSRNLQVVALTQDDTFSKRFIYYFAMFWSAFAVIYIGCITFVEIPTNNVRFADVIIGFLLGTIIATIIGFFYGNSIKKENK